jgi:hypothetical protein
MLLIIIVWDFNTLFTNTTLTVVNITQDYRPIIRLVNLNYVCKELDIDSAHRRSVPNHLTTKTDIRKFLLELNRGFEEWKAMKIVFLGNGRISKTTLLNVIKNVMGISYQVLSFLFTSLNLLYF